MEIVHPSRTKILRHERQVYDGRILVPSISPERRGLKVAAASAELARRNWHGMCVAVVDTHGDLLYFEGDDRCQYNSINVSQRKARMAARSRVPTVAYERRLASGLYNAYLPTLGPDYILSRGGNPLVLVGKIVGAIGVSGGAGSQDNTISQAGGAALK